MQRKRLLFLMKRVRNSPVDLAALQSDWCSGVQPIGPQLHATGDSGAEIALSRRDILA